MFSRQVEAFMRYRAMQTLENKDVSSKYRGSAFLCRFTRLYYTVLRSKGVSAETRTKVLGFLIVQLYSKMKASVFVPWQGEHVLGVHRHTFEVCKFGLI